MKKQNKIYLGIGIVAIILIAAIVMFSAPKGEETIKIGATLALSGPYAFIGQAELNGLELATNEINSNGGINGKNIMLIAEDNKGDAAMAVTGVTKMIDLNDVNMVISAFTHISNAVKDITMQRKKILLYASTSKNIAEESKWNFRDYYDAEENGEAIAKIVKKEGHKKVAFLTEVSDQCRLYEGAFRNKAKELGIEITKREEYLTSEKDLKTNLLKLNLIEADALVTCSWRHEDILMKQMKELGLINKQSFHWVAPLLPNGDTDEIRELYEENNAISTWHGIMEPETDKQKEFFSRYQSIYGGKPKGDAMYAYDDLFILSFALKTCDAIGKLKDPDCLSKELLKTNYEGLLGKIKFDEKGASKRDVNAIEVKNGEWINYKFN